MLNMDGIKFMPHEKSVQLPVHFGALEVKYLEGHIVPQAGQAVQCALPLRQVHKLHAGEYLIKFSFVLKVFRILSKCDQMQFMFRLQPPGEVEYLKLISAVRGIWHPVGQKQYLQNEKRFFIFSIFRDPACLALSPGKIYYIYLA